MSSNIEPAASVPGDQLMSRTYDLVERLTKTRLQHWRSEAVIAVLAISLFFCFPWYPNVSRKPWVVVLQTAHHPLHDLGYGQGSHQARMVYRPVVPFIGGLLHLNIAGYMVLQAVAGVALFIVFVVISDRFIQDPPTCVLLLLALGATYAGVMSFVELRGNFDGISIFFVFLAMIVRRPWVLAILAFIAPWNDERALLALGFVVVFWQAQRTISSGNPVRGDSVTGWRRTIAPQAASVVLGACLYLVSRLAATRTLNLPVGIDSGDGLGRAIDQINNLPVGMWTGLEGLWILPILAIVLLVKNREWVTSAIFGLSIVAIVAFAISVVDITRSMAYLAPAVLASLPILTANVSTAYMRRLVGFAVIASVVWPVYYVGGRSAILWIYPLPVQVVHAVAT